MILLTFNIENNQPKLKNGTVISDEELIEITKNNTTSILRILEHHNEKATFFVDVELVSKIQDVLKNVISDGHEVAILNNDSSPEFIEEIKKNLEDFLEKQIRGIRQKKPDLNTEEIKLMEFSYVSNIENATILFPLKRLLKSTKITEEMGISFVPESISPYAQIPYNDFVFQIVPLQYYQNMVVESLQNDEYVMIYLNTWQFTEEKDLAFDIPFYRSINNGLKLEDKLQDFLTWVAEREIATSRMKDYIF